MTQENRSGRQAEIHITQMRRNPYLVDYQTGKNTGRHTGRRIEQRHHSAVPHAFPTAKSCRKALFRRHKHTAENKGPSLPQGKNQAGKVL